MSDLNPFAPPTNDEPLRAQVVDSSGERFFLVSRPKFIIMSLATFGMYELYWFYKNWKQTKARVGSDISPLARAIFTLFYTHALLRDVRVAAAEADVAPRFMIQSSAWGFIVLTLLHRLPDPFWLVSLASFVPLVPVVDTINDLHRKISPTADPNASFGLGNWVAMAVGLVVWALNAVALFIPEEALAP